MRYVMREASPRRHSIPFQVVCPSPPLLFSFFSALWRMDERHARHTTSLFFPLTHTTTHFTHTKYECGTKYPRPSSSHYNPPTLLLLRLVLLSLTHTNRNDNYAPRLPVRARLASPRPTKRTGYAVLVLLRATSRYFTGDCHSGDLRPWGRKNPCRALPLPA